MLVAAVVALPVRSTVAVNELHRMQARWAWFEALDGQRASLDLRLAEEAQDVTDPRVTAGRAALAAEELPLVRKARSALLAGQHLPDSGLHRLRQGMALAFADQAADLGLIADPRRSAQPPAGRGQATQLAVDRVKLLLDGELARWRQPAVQRTVAAPLVAAGAALAELAIPADRPMAARLVLVGQPGTLTTVDLSKGGGGPSSRQYPSSSAQLTGPIVARAGYLAVAAGNSPGGAPPVYAIRPDLRGTPKIIGSTVNNAVVAAAEPDAVWLQHQGVALEVNGSGALLNQALIASDRTLVGATDQLLITTGLVTSEPSSDLQVVPLNGLRRNMASVVSPRAQLVAATTGLMAWLDIDTHNVVVVRLADGAGHDVRTVGPAVLAGRSSSTGGTTPPSSPGQATNAPNNQAAPVNQALPIDAGAFSPDGTRLAVRYLLNGADTRLAIIEVATAGVRLVDGSIGDRPAGPIVWSSDGQRVFFIEQTGSRSRIATWQVGTAFPTVIRIAAPQALSLAATTP